MNTILCLNDISVKWISSIIDVDERSVEGLTVEHLGELPVSEAAVVNIHYRKESTGLPNSLFVKISNKNTQTNLPGYGQKEVVFYNTNSSKMNRYNIPKCYYAVYEEKRNIYNIVLEDLSKTHFQTEYPLAPTIPYCRKAIDCLATLHSQWWDSEDLEKATATRETKESNSGYIEYLHKLCLKFISFMQDRLDKDSRKILHHSLDHMEKLYERYLGFNNMTLIHSDAHMWNFMLPKEKDGFIKLIDWQSYENGLGAYDLAYMMALHWFPSRRKEYEHELLMQYHGTLKKNGVKDYSYDDLYNDYRISVIQLLFLPAYQYEVNLSAGIWLNHLERIFCAYDDLNCKEMFD